MDSSLWFFTVFLQEVFEKMGKVFCHRLLLFLFPLILVFSSVFMLICEQFFYSLFLPLSSSIDIWNGKWREIEKDLAKTGVVLFFHIFFLGCWAMSWNKNEIEEKQEKFLLAAVVGRSNLEEILDIYALAQQYFHCFSLFWTVSRLLNWVYGWFF